MKRRVLPLILLAVAATPARAKDGEIWINGGASGPLSGRVQGSVDTIVRADGDGVYEWVASGAIGYRIDEHATVWTGYVHKTAYADDATSTEQRVREDLVLEDVARIGPVRVGGRVRVEERWRDDAAGLGWRVRPQLRLTLPLTKDGPAMVTAVEGFFNMGDGAGQRAGYDRVRESIGVQVPLTRSIRFDAGYLRQWTRGAGTIGAATTGLALRW